MADIALSSPVHLVIHPEEPIRSLEAAAKVVERQASLDPAAGRLAERLRAAEDAAERAAAEAEFREWAEQEGLLLVPPEDDQRH